MAKLLDGNGSYTSSLCTMQHGKTLKLKWDPPHANYIPLVILLLIGLGNFCIILNVSTSGEEYPVLISVALL